MLEFNQELKNYEPKNFPIITIDNSKTLIKEDAYTIDIYDDEHFFVGVYIANIYSTSLKIPIINKVKDWKSSKFDINYKRKFLDINALSTDEEKSVIAYKFLIDLEGNITEFAINKEKIKIDHSLNEDDISYLLSNSDDNLKDEEITLSNMLQVMNSVSDLIYINRTDSKDAEERDKDFEFHNSFFTQFGYLVNIHTAKMLHDNNIPFLYHNSVKVGEKIIRIDNYYTSRYEGNVFFNTIVGAFTSPIRDCADAVNTAILDDILNTKNIESVSSY